MFIRSIAVILFFISTFAFSAGNPAYEKCVDNGGMIETRTDNYGNEYGICIFMRNSIVSECGQWAFFRGECKPNECAHWSIAINACEIPW